MNIKQKEKLKVQRTRVITALKLLEKAKKMRKEKEKFERIIDEAKHELQRVLGYLTYLTS